MVATVPGVSAHFARFTVTEISMQEAALRQFDDSKILEAARLLADARVDVIGWSGTSSSWLGFERDAQLCTRITEATGIPATTSVMALNELLAAAGVRKLGLVTPYRADVQERIVANFRGIGVDCSAERHLGISVNFDFAEVEPDSLARMAREVAAAGCDAITMLCTNLRSAQLAETLERELGLPVFDSTATVVWKALKLAGADTRQVHGWGRMFRDF
jgi:maleate isomerase